MDVRELCIASLQPDQNQAVILEKTTELLSNFDNIVVFFDVLMNETDITLGQAEANLIKQIIYRHFKLISKTERINDVLPRLIQIFNNPNLSDLVKTNLIDGLFPIFENILLEWTELHEFVKATFTSNINICLSIMNQISEFAYTNELEPFILIISDLLQFAFSTDDIQIIVKASKLLANTIYILGDVSEYFEKLVTVFEASTSSAEINQSCYDLANSIKTCITKDKEIFDPFSLLVRLVKMEASLNQVPWLVIILMNKILKVFGKRMNPEELDIQSLVQLSVAKAVDLCRSQEIDDSITSYVNAILLLLIRCMRVTDVKGFVQFLFEYLDSIINTEDLSIIFVALSTYRLIVNYGMEVLPIFISNIVEKIAAFIDIENELIIKAAAECAGDIATYANSVYDCSQLFILLVGKLDQLYQEANEVDISCLLRSIIPFLYYVNVLPQDAILRVIEICVLFYENQLYQLDCLYVFTEATPKIQDMSACNDKFKEIAFHAYTTPELSSVSLELFGALICSGDESIVNDVLTIFNEVLMSQDYIIENARAVYVSLTKIAIGSNESAKASLIHVIQLTIEKCISDRILKSEDDATMELFGLMMVFMSECCQKLEVPEDILERISQVCSILIRSSMDWIVAPALPLIMVADVASNTDYDEDFELALEAINSSKEVAYGVLLALKQLMTLADDLFEEQIQKIIELSVHVLTRKISCLDEEDTEVNNLIVETYQNLCLAAKRYTMFFDASKYFEFIMSRIENYSSYEFSLSLTPLVSYFSSQVEIDVNFAQTVLQQIGIEKYLVPGDVPPHALQLISRIASKFENFRPESCRILQTILNSEISGGYANHIKFCCAANLLSLYVLGSCSDDLVKSAIPHLAIQGLVDDAEVAYTALLQMAQAEGVVVKFLAEISNLFENINIDQLEVADEIKAQLHNLHAAIVEGQNAQ